jgi:hypothetical protein
MSIPLCVKCAELGRFDAGNSIKIGFIRAVRAEVGIVAAIRLAAASLYFMWIRPMPNRECAAQTRRRGPHSLPFAAIRT